jgi:hypothetical protein
MIRPEKRLTLQRRIQVKERENLPRRGHPQRIKGLEADLGLCLYLASSLL